MPHVQGKVHVDGSEFSVIAGAEVRILQKDKVVVKVFCDRQGVFFARVLTNGPFMGEVVARGFQTKRHPLVVGASVNIGLTRGAPA